VPTTNGAFRIQPTDNAVSQPSRVGSRGAARNSYVTEIVRLRSWSRARSCRSAAVPCSRDSRSDAP